MVGVLCALCVAAAYRAACCGACGASWTGLVVACSWRIRAVGRLLGGKRILHAPPLCAAGPTCLRPPLPAVQEQRGLHRLWHHAAPGVAAEQPHHSSSGQRGEPSPGVRPHSGERTARTMRLDAFPRAYDARVRQAIATCRQRCWLVRQRGLPRTPAPAACRLPCMPLRSCLHSVSVTMSPATPPSTAFGPCAADGSGGRPYGTQLWAVGRRGARRAAVSVMSKGCVAGVWLHATVAPDITQGCCSGRD